MLYRFAYDQDNKQLIGKEINGPLVKFIQLSEKLDKVEMQECVCANLYKNWCPIMLDRNNGLVYVGTLNCLMVFTTDTRQAIGKFSCCGMPKSMCKS